LGYYPQESAPADQPHSNEQPIIGLAQALEHLIAAHPEHPYALVGVEGVVESLQAFQELCAAAGYPLHGSIERNWLLPSAVGAIRPTCLAPETMVAGDLSLGTPILVVGFEHFVDFYPELIAANLSYQGFPAEAVILHLPALAARRITTPTMFARLMEQPAFRTVLVDALQPHLGQAQRVGFPAVLGTTGRQAAAIRQELEERFGRPVFEIPGLPPSVPGIRLHHILKQAVEAAGGQVYEGLEVVGAEQEEGGNAARITAVYTEAAARHRAHRFDHYILATGGILGGGITTNHDRQVRETIFNLPVTVPTGPLDWFRQDFMDKEGHPLYRAGIRVNEQFQPVDGEGRPLFSNLYATGTTLGHCDPIRERAFDGIALATGYTLGKHLARIRATAARS
jgi:glycerol-3-phosphate dehydrogenase subunit B